MANLKYAIDIEELSKKKGSPNMVRCNNCGAELPDDAAFCENCGARITPITAPSPPPAPPSPPAAQPSYPPPPPPPSEKEGPPMKMVAIGAGIIVLLLVAVVFMASNATSGLKITFQSGQLVTNWVTGDLTVSVTLKIEGAGIFGVDITSNYMTLRLKSGGMDATFFSGYAPRLVTSVPGGGITVTETFIVDYTSWWFSTSKAVVWANALWSGFSMSLDLSGTLETKCLFFTGSSTVSTGWHTIVYS